MAALAAFIFLADPAVGDETPPEAPEGEPKAEAQEEVPTVHYMVVEGIVNPVMAEFVEKSLDSAAEAGAEAVVIQLDTPGGLDLSMRIVVKAILSSEVPVAVYVAPSGSRAASAGVFITYAANVAAMAPGTNIGSASPVAMGGGEMDETMQKKVLNDAVAYIKSIADKRGRNAEWAEKAVREAVNITAEEALELKVVDLVAISSAELLEKMDGVEVEVVTGKRTLSTAGAEIEEVEMGLRYRILNAISNPNVAYILMMIGLIGIYFELSNPGAILPGVLGAICLILAFYAFQTLPVNYAGLLLIGLAVVFFIAEIMVVSYGLLTIAGVVSLILGSLMLFESSAPYMELSIWVILPTVVFMTAFILGTMYFAVKVFRKTPVSGSEGLVGEIGTASADIDAGAKGTVFVEGEYWNAVAEEDIREGDKVMVTGLEGLELKVKKARE